MENKHMIRCLTPLAFREIQIKITMKYHYTPITMSKIKSSGNANVGKDAEKLHHSYIYCWWECKMVQLLWRAVWQFLEKLNMQLPCDPVITLLGTYSREMKTYVHIKNFYINICSRFIQNILKLEIT